MAMTTSKTGYRAGHAPLPSGRVRGAVPRPVARRGADVDRLHRRLPPPARRADRAGRDRGHDHRARARRGRLPPRAAGASSQALPRSCAEHGILFVADEVQSGFGRTGKMFAIEHTRRRARRDRAWPRASRPGFPISRDRRVGRAHGALADRQPRRHLRRQPDRLRGGARHHRRAHRARASSTTSSPAASSSPTGSSGSGSEHPAIVDVRGPGLMVGVPVRRRRSRRRGAAPLPRTTASCC